LAFSPKSNRRLYGTSIIILLLTIFVPYAFTVGPSWSQTDRTYKTGFASDQTSYAQSLFIAPSLIERTHADIGTSFEVSVTIENVSDLFGFDLNITWDNTLIRLSSVAFGPYLDQLWGQSQWFVAANQTSPGWYKLAAVSTSQSFTGTNSAILFTLDFRVEDAPAGETPIHFASVKLSDSEYTPIVPTETLDATYRMLSTPLETVLLASPNLIEKTQPEIGTNFNVSIIMNYVTDFFGFDMNITWDNSLLTFNHSYNDSLNILWGTGKWYTAKDESGAGWYKLVAVSTANGFNTTGTQTIFTLEFRVEDPHSNTARETPIHLDTHKLSDSQYNTIVHTTEDGTYRIMGETPALTINPNGKTCRMYGETFAIEVNLSKAFNVTGFKWQIDYNTTLLDYVGITWNQWGSGTINVNEIEGNITGSTSGAPISGTQILITISFKAACYHIWKNAPGWINNLNDAIFIQHANLSYPSSPDLQYARGEPSQIVVGPDFAYTFSPILGDVNNNGVVDVLDLRTVAIYHMVKQGDPNWTEASTYDLNGDGIVDVFDLRTVAYNFGYTYTP
jgi:hypothetical protein